MIYKATIPEQVSFVSKIPSLSGKTFHFSDNVNVIIGPKNSGKSVLIKGIAAYCGIEFKFGSGAGWSDLLSYSNAPKPLEFPKAFIHNLEDKDRYILDLDWDGTPSFMLDGYMCEATNRQTSIFNKSSSNDKLTDPELHKFAKKYVHGSVEQMLFKLNHCLKFELLSNYQIQMPQSMYYNAEQKKACFDYIASLTKTNRITLIIDNLESQFNIKDSYFLWNKCIPELQEICNLQIIIATHTIMPALIVGKKFNIIELDDGYIEVMARYQRFFCDRFLRNKKKYDENQTSDCDDQAVPQK